MPPADQVPAQAGNPDFDRLFRETFRPLTAVGLAAGLTLQDAEDAAEMALLEVSQRWPTLTTPRAWAYRATFSAIKKNWRKQSAEARALERKFPHGDYPPETYEDPGLAAVDYHDWVTTLLRALPPAQREAAACCLVDGLTPAEAARLLGIPGATMRQRLRAALQSLHLLVEADVKAAGSGRRAGTRTIPAVTAGRKEVL